MADQQRATPMAIAMTWVGRVFGVVAMMVLPGVGGGWFDRRWGIGWLAPLGVVLGSVAGVTYLILLTRREGVRRVSPEIGDETIQPSTIGSHDRNNKR